MTEKEIEQKDKYFIVITLDKYPLGDAGAVRTQWTIVAKAVSSYNICEDI